MKYLRHGAGGLMLLSGVTRSADFLLSPPSPSNTPVAAVFGVCFLVIGALLVVRAGVAALWLAVLVSGISAVLGTLVAFGSSEFLPTFHAVISWLVALICIFTLFQRKTRRIAVVITAIALSCGGIGLALLLAAFGRDPFAPTYEENCSVCHGENLEGLPLGPPLVGRELLHGDSVADISKSISLGFAASGMPAWSEALDEIQIQGLALLISERRSGFSLGDFNVDRPLAIPAGTIESEHHDFHVEIVASGLHPRPFSIAPLPDGRILLSEKTRGLSIISTDGEQSALIRGTPPTHDGGFQPPNRLVYGLGWMMDVALHPDYEENGWIYIHFGDRCSDCDTSMNKLVRGRIVDGHWIDEAVIWHTDPDFYSQGSDMGRGGRISFDDDGHVFLSVGMKGNSNYEGIQDLGQPYGKIHRVHDDGSIPSDNPFVGVAGALPSTWTYGHRSPQGLEFDPVSGHLWSTEMGPRGGDEFNLLLPGRNYGWPLYSKGVNYDGTRVEYGKQLGIALDLAAIEQPVVDMTPAPAVSSFIVYQGDLFPEWRHDVIVGTLKATELYRWVLEGDRVVHAETLLRGVARIRDVESGADGSIYLLLEHASGGQIVRLVRD